MSANRFSTASTILGATVAIVAALAIAVVASAKPVAAVASARPASIELRRTSLGEVLVNGRGFTLYTFSRDGN